MYKQISLGLIIIIGLSLFGNQAGISYAAREDNVELMRKLYAELAAVLKVGDTKLAPNTNMLMLAAPGIMLDPKVDMTQPQGAATIINTLIDKVIEPSWIYSTRQGRMTDIYQEILRSHVVPTVKLEAEEKAELESARSLLYRSNGTDMPLLAEYRVVRQALTNSLLKIASWQEENPGKPTPARLRVELQQATDEYTRKRGDVARGALLTLAKYDRRNGEFWFDKLQGRFDANFITNYYYGLTLLYPSYATWLDPKLEWERIEVTSKDLEKRTHNESSSGGGGLSAQWGLWSIGGDYQEDETRSYEQSEVKNMALKFDVMRVAIDLPWMDATVFESGAWDWSNNTAYPGQLISDGGNYKAGVMPQGLMPVIPTGILVARNVELSADWSFDVKEFIEKRRSGGGSIGYGPFKLGGRKSKNEKDTYELAQANGNKVTFAHPQIIGYFVQALPKSPNRDMSRTWPDRPLGEARLMGVTQEADPLLDQAKKVLNDLK